MGGGVHTCVFEWKRKKRTQEILERKRWLVFV